MEQAVQWVLMVVGEWGYAGIVVMMALESSFVPFPSEAVMIPAGYLAHKGEMNMALAVGAGVLGSLVGALVNYYLAVWMGRPLLLRYGRYFFVSEKNLLKAEAFFRRHGEIGTFVGRLIPVIRQYISLPAGLARMNMGRFLFYTALGAGIWMTILAWIGYFAGENEALVRRYWRQAVTAVLAGSVVLVAVYVVVYRRFRSGSR